MNSLVRFSCHLSRPFNIQNNTVQETAKVPSKIINGCLIGMNRKSSTKSLELAQGDQHIPRKEVNAGTLLFITFVLSIFCLWPFHSWAEDAVYRRAFPTPIPPDATFDTVVSTQPAYIQLRYPVPIIGWKNHPEEIHVTPEGALVFPEPRQFPMYISPLISIANSDPKILPPDGVVTSLVDGYKPGVNSAWSVGGLEIHQLAFGSLLEGQTVVSGREVLLGLARYTFRNSLSHAVSGTFYLNFGKALFGESQLVIPPVYPGSLKYQEPCLLESDGRTAMTILQNSLGKTDFLPFRAKPDAYDVTVLNAAGATVSNPQYDVSVTRNGDSVSNGSWHSDQGMDLYYLSSSAGGSASAVEVNIVSSTATNRIGFLSKAGFTENMPSTSDFILPMEHSGKLGWSQLKKMIPEGQSTLSLYPYYVSPTGPAKAYAWEPKFYLTKPGVEPHFKNEGNAYENSICVAFELRPGESRSLEIAVPYFPVDGAKVKELKQVKLDTRLAEFRDYWEKELNSAAQFDVPEKRVRDGYRAWIAYNMLLVDKDPITGLLLIHPDATMYEHVWAGDAAVVMQTMDRMGYNKEVEDYTKYFFVRQGARKPEGDIDTSDGFFCGDSIPWLSENGFVLWALCEHYKLTGDMDWLRAAAPRLIDSANWIVNERERTKVLENGKRPRSWGLLPKGRPSDLGDWDYWYFNDTLSYKGLRDAGEVLAEAGHAEAARKINAAAADYKSCILSSIEQSINRDVSPPFVPLTPYKNDKPTADNFYRYWYALNPPAFMVDAGLTSATNDLITWGNYWVEKLGMVSGLCKFMPETPDPHYIYDQALTYLLRGETDKFVWSFYSLLAYGQSRSTYATIEWSNIKTGIKETDAWDDCRQPHMHSNSRCLSMLRIALLLEDGDTLHLMMGTPRGWLSDGKKIEIRQAPTYFGPISYRAKSSIGSGVISVTVVPPARKPANLVLHIRPPTMYGEIKSVTVNGVPWKDFTAQAVNLGRMSSKTSVVCHF